MFLNGLITKAARSRLVLAAALGLAIFSVATVQAQSVVTNTATVTPPDGVVDTDPTNNSSSAEVTILSAEEYSFCAAPGGSNAIFSVSNGVQIWRYDHPGGTPERVTELDETIGGTLNALMIDAANDRLLFHIGGTNGQIRAYDADNGGWYQAATVSGTFPRAGMAPDGTGYLIEGGSETPRIVQITPQAAPSFGYDVVELGNLSYDFAPTATNSGDIAFDGEGIAWITTGLDLYRIDFSQSGGPVAQRQTRPQGATVDWAGVAFADNGDLIMAGLNGQTYAYDFATGNLTLATTITPGALQSRDLASCAFPIPPSANLSVQKTLAQVNGEDYDDGAPVFAGNTLTYAITIENTGGAAATVYAGDVAETVPAGTTHAGGDDFTCTGGDCLNTADYNVPAGDSVTLEFSVTVIDPVPAGVTSIANAVTFPNGTIDCDAAGNDCEEETPLGPSVTIAKSADPGSGTAVSAGDTLDYTLTVTVASAATLSDVVLTDVLGDGLTVDEASLPTGCEASGQTVTCTLPAPAAVGEHAFTYQATVDADATVSVSNSVTATGGRDPDDPSAPDPECATPDGCQTEHDLNDPSVTIAKSADPGSGTAVSVGDTLDYTLTVDVANAATLSDVVLTDTLGTGLALDAATLPAECSAAGQTVTCTLASGAAVGGHTFAYTATVTAAATTSVENAVTAAGGGDPDDPSAPDPECATPDGCQTEHPVDKPEVTVAKSADPASGESVTVGQVITYTLTVEVANAATLSDVVLTDTLGTGLVLDAATLPAECSAAGQTVTCTLASGADVGEYTFSYAATVTADASTSVQNTVVAEGGNDPNDPNDPPPPTCDNCSTEHPVDKPEVTVAKSSDPASGESVTVGQVITYTLTVEVASAATLSDVVLTDTLGTGLELDAATLPAECSAAGQTVTCTLASGADVGEYTFSYAATVTADATTSVQNTVVAEGGNDPNDPNDPPPPTCDNCSTEHPVDKPEVTVAKSSDPASGESVTVGQVITYTLTVDVGNAPLLSDVLVTDTLGTGLELGTVTAPAFACNDANPLACTLPNGTDVGTYTVTYTATVTAEATTSVQNTVVAEGGNDPNDPNDPPPPTCDNCSTEHPVDKPEVTVAKSSDPASGTAVTVGQVITYTLTVDVASAATLSDVVLTDTLGTGLALDAASLPAECSAAGQTVTCTLASGADVGEYTFAYAATVTADATTSVENAVTASGGNDPDDPANPQPDCTSCSTEHPVEKPVVTVAKTADPAEGETVAVGQVITYTLTVDVANAATLSEVVVTDTLGTGLELGTVTAPAFACNDASPLVCTLPEGAGVGSYVVTYTATVTADARTAVDNSVVAEGGNDPGDPDNPQPDCTSCSTSHELANPRILLGKSSNPDSGMEVEVGDTIDYTLSVTVENASLTEDLRLVDTPDAGLTIDALPAGCVTEGGDIVCVLSAGAVPGDYVFTYAAVVNPSATDTVRNVVTGQYPDSEPECVGSCETEHTVITGLELRIVKTVGARQIRVGDLVRYSVVVENIGARDWIDGVVIDTPPAGFSYVEGSMGVADDDGEFVLAGNHPLRIEGVDIAVGRSATITYLLRVGAGVRNGVHINQAVAVAGTGEPISNVATAEVLLDGDPLLDDSLIFGTVFDDRDGDGWQDRADLGGVVVSGGFAPGAYVPNSTTMDTGSGPQPLADASSPLLRGIQVGAIAARESEADPAPTVVIRQRLSALDYTSDFVLTSNQGVTVRMNAEGETSVELSGDAARGLNAAEPTVERSVAAVEGGYEVAYTIANQGIDERGIPGVRIASVEGLLIETDQYGRYHLADVHGGDWGRGRNFILKVDPATLPAGTEFTTENPLVRRVTPGIPVRFDFGVKLPVAVLPGGLERIALELGEVIFAPGSAQVREIYLPVIEQVAERANAYEGGEVTITADGDSQALAFARAEAVRDILLPMLSAEAQQALEVVLRTSVEDPHAAPLAGVTASGALLGTVLFDTDRSAIRPEFNDLLDAVAARLEAMGGGVVIIVGHTDVRASHAYNAALGLRRATSVYEALRSRLSPEVRERVRVESSGDPAAPIGTDAR